MQPIRTLILSGGGGRGAFHAGVYNYLCQANKPDVNDDHQGEWSPNIVVGTSIGAVNGAAIVQGMLAPQLEAIWRSLREADIQGLPPGMSRLSRWVANLVFRQSIGVRLPTVSPQSATSPQLQDAWLPFSLGPKWLSEKLFGRWSNFLDTGPLLQTMESRLGLDEARINGSDKTLLITATNVRTGGRVMFSNHPILKRTTGKPRTDVIEGITLKRILASCSIPLVYPWTVDENQVYWDGAVVANTPLGGALDAAGDCSMEASMEVVVVMMTPWRETENGQPSEAPLPGSFEEAVTITLDWALLGTFRERLKVIEAYNHLARLERGTEKPEQAVGFRYRDVKVVIVAPQDFFPMTRIIDYDERTDLLIQQGYTAAENAFQKHFG